jgi:hypothetical protein
MGYYENVKCGNCKYSFTDGYRRSNGILKTYLGVPYVKCPKCNKVNKTGFKPYSTYHPLEKVYHWFSILLRYTIFALILGIIIVGGLQKFFFKDLEIFGSVFIVMTVLSVVCVNAYAIMSELKEIKDVEEEYARIT